MYFTDVVGNYFWNWEQFVLGSPKSLDPEIISSLEVPLTQSLHTFSVNCKTPSSAEIKQVFMGPEKKKLVTSW